MSFQVFLYAAIANHANHILVVCRLAFLELSGIAAYKCAYGSVSVQNMLKRMQLTMIMS